MRHVDEGLLHAWIDGAFEAGTPEREEIEAHLAGCADCRVRLEDARRVRDVAQDVLAAASPRGAAAPPPWDAIVAEHARRRDGGGTAVLSPAPSRTARPRIPLAWAASLILAVGAGWMGRAMLAERASSPVQQEMLESADALEDLDAAALRQEAASPPAGAGAVVSEPPVPSSAARRDGNAASPPPAVSVEESRLRERVTTRSPAEAQRFSDERAAAAKAAAPTTANLGRSLAADAAQGIVSTMPAAPLTQVVDSVAGRWVAADAQAVATALGTPPLVVAGLTPDSVQLGTVDGAAIARSVFVLADGVVEVLQRAAVLDEAAPAAREAESVVAQSTFSLRGIEVLVRGSSAAAVDDVRRRLR